MRPKKIVLLVNSDEQALSIASFLLTTRGYRVYATLSLVEAFQAILHRRPELVVVPLESRFAGNQAALDGCQAVALLKDAYPLVHYLLTSSQVSTRPRREHGVDLVPRMVAPAHRADLFLDRHATEVDFVEAVKILTSRKRGPRAVKREPRSVGTAVPAEHQA